MVLYILEWYVKVKLDSYPCALINCYYGAINIYISPLLLWYRREDLQVYLNVQYMYSGTYDVHYMTVMSQYHNKNVHVQL